MKKKLNRALGPGAREELEAKTGLRLGDCEFSLVSYVTLGELCNLPVPEFS